MPVLVPVSRLEPGMVLASNIVNRFSVLLPHHHKLSENDIAALLKRFPEKMVQVVDPLLDDAIEFGDCSHDQQISLEVRRNIASVSQKVSRGIRSGTNLTADNIQGMQRTINEMMNYLQDNPVTLAIIEQTGSWDDYLQEHSANVFYLSMVMGNTIRNYIKRERERLSAAKIIHDAMNLTPLATAAMLHDIGMVPIEHLYHKQEPLTDAEIKKVKSHPTVGAKMLPDSLPPMVHLVVRCHHENCNGSGYPEGLPGDRIPIFARILRIADAFTAATSATMFRQAKSQARVLYEMIYGSFRQYYDPVILRVLEGIIQPFMVGASLKMTSGQIAVVTKHNPKNAFAPQVIIAFDEYNNPLPEDKIDGPFFLDERDDVEIVSFEEEDVSFVNQARHKQGVDLEESAAEIFEKTGELFDLACP